MDSSSGCETLSTEGNSHAWNQPPGTLGFLAEVDRQSVYAALDKLKEDDYEIEERMMLTGTVWRR